MAIPNKPECIHRAYYGKRDDSGEYTTWCDECGAALYRGGGMGGTIEVLDPVYEMLYTNEGRTRLLAELLKERGWEIPSCWSLS